MTLRIYTYDHPKTAIVIKKNTKEKDLGEENLKKDEIYEILLSNWLFFGDTFVLKLVIFRISPSHSAVESFLIG